MAYKLRCKACRQTFVSATRNKPCPNCRADRDYGTDFICDVLDTALDVATAVAVAHVTGDILGGAVDVVSGLFDW